MHREQRFFEREMAYNFSTSTLQLAAAAVLAPLRIVTAGVAIVAAETGAADAVETEAAASQNVNGASVIVEQLLMCAQCDCWCNIAG